MIMLFSKDHLIKYLITVTIIYINDADCFCNMYTENMDIVYDCRQSNLTEIPNDVPTNVTVLLLADNKIEIIRSNSLSHVANLKILILSRNIISKLEPSSFAGLNSLRKLFLQQNHLDPTNITYPDEIFRDLVNLRVLHLYRNCFTKGLHLEYPDVAFGHLVSLTELYIDGIKDLKFGPGFQKIQNLTKLVMSGSVGECNLTKLANDTFENLAGHVEWLDMNNCQDIHHVHPLTFAPLKHLQYLDLSFTMHLLLPGFVNVTHGLMFTPVITVNLSHFQSFDEGYINLSPVHFRYIANTSIEELILEYNHIINIHADVVEYFPPNLTHLSLRDNTIDNSEVLNKMYLFKKLRYIDISYQFHDRNERKENIRGRDFIFENFMNGRGHDNQSIRLPPNLEHILASHLKLRYPIPQLFFSENKIKFIDISYNSFTAIIGKLHGLQKVELFSLSKNNMGFISPFALGDMFGLKVLLLNGNRFGECLNRDTNELTFSNQTNLELLDLSSNQIKSLPKYIFRSQKRLQHLLLNNNSLTSVDFSMKGMKLINVFDFSFNQLSVLTQDNRIELDGIASTAQNTTVLLHGNPLLCSCDHVDFLKWLQRTKVKINYMTYRCLYKNGSYVSMAYLKDIVQKLEMDCIATEVLEACIVTFVGLLVLLSIPALIYHKRWKLRYLYYIGRRNTNPYQPLDTEVYQEFDAYISYADTSYDFVVNKLHPALVPKELKIHGKEQLISDAPMARCISDGISKSNKVVALLTNDYFRDQWATFEFHIAIQGGIYMRREVVIPVIMEDLRMESIPEDISVFLKSNICYVYPHEGRQLQFWEYLESKIRG